MEGHYFSYWEYVMVKDEEEPDLEFEPLVVGCVFSRVATVNILHFKMLI